MKLEKFKEKNKKKTFIILFTVSCIFLLVGIYIYTSFAVFSEEKNFNVINGSYQDPGDLYFAIYVDDKMVQEMPKQNEGYAFNEEKSTCTNGATISWDNSNWTAIVNLSNYTKENMSRTKCTMYFTKSIISQIISNLDKTGSCPTVNEDGGMNITSTESEKSLVCSAPDDYGTSYYFRGNVENNWVKFAGYYWRIIRINGDGSVRMIYAGDASVIDALPNKEEVLKNGYDDWSTKYTQIGEYGYTYNYTDSNNDNAYVGYMYGTPGSSSYEETHANINDSAIKTYIDSWYEEHLLNTEYESYISDTLFCNDRSLLTETEISNEFGEVTFNQLGYGKNNTVYRWGGDMPYAELGPEYEFAITYPNFKCTQHNDRFTVDSEIGNGALTYPVATVTADDVYAAGGYSEEINNNYYLFTGNLYWTISPNDFSFNTVEIRRV